MKVDMRNKPKWYSVLLVGLILLLATSAVACGKPAPAPTTWSTSPESAILGKWRHGFPEECPPNMDIRQCEELKKLPENKTYYLEFLENGQVLNISEGEEWLADGTYEFIGDTYVKIKWSVLRGTFFNEIYLFKFEISGNKMTLHGQGCTRLIKE